MSFLTIIVVAMSVSATGEPSDYSERELWLRDGWDLSPVVNEVCQKASRIGECGALAEARFLMLYPSVRRDSTGIVIKLTSGRSIRFEENHGGGDTYRSFHYLGMVEALPYHLLVVWYIEGHTYWMIHARTGQKTAIDSFPSVSPDGKRIATARIEELGEIPDRLQIWTTQADSLTLEAALHTTDIPYPDRRVVFWKVTRPRWRSAFEVIVDVWGQARTGPHRSQTPFDTTAVFTYRTGKWVLK